MAKKAKSKAIVTPFTCEAVGSAWRAAEKVFANRRAMRPSAAHFYGLVERTHPNRMGKLLNAQKARAVSDIFQKLDDRQLGQFRTMAFVNLEQATSAMRLNVIGNISIPVGFLVLVNQLLPNRLGLFISEIGAEALLFICSVVLALLVVTMWYAYAGVLQARDLYHLTLIETARRGDVSPADTPSDAIEAPLEPETLS